MPNLVLFLFIFEISNFTQLFLFCGGGWGVGKVTQFKNWKYDFTQLIEFWRVKYPMI